MTKLRSALLKGWKWSKGTCRLIYPISLRGNDKGKTYPALKAAPSGNSCFSVKEHLLMHTITNTTQNTKRTWEWKKTLCTSTADILWNVCGCIDRRLNVVSITVVATSFYKFYWMEKQLINKEYVTNLCVVQVLTGSELLSELPLSSRCCRLSVGVMPGKEKTAGKMQPSQISER